MLDYKLLDALRSIVQAGSFEGAAKLLCITQAAVSLRIKSLEEHFGQPLLIRSSPPRLTEIGERILKHATQVHMLEGNLLTDIETSAVQFQLGIATNADSLATWLIDALEEIYQDSQTLIELYEENEAYTHTLLKDGRVFASIGTLKKPLQGCDSFFLGRMRYLLVATPAFIARYFPTGVRQSALQKAPIAVFDRKDTLQEKFFAKYFHSDIERMPEHLLPSPDAYVRVIKSGGAYGLVPSLQCQEALDAGALVNVLPQRFVDVSLYLQTWQMQTEISKMVTQAILNHAFKVLRQH